MSRRVFQTLISMLLVGLAAGGVAQALQFDKTGGEESAFALNTPAYCPTPAEGALLDLINGYRAEKGLAPLALVVPLGAAARHHAESMATYNYFDFTLVPEDATFDQNLRIYGYAGSYVGANIAAGPASDTAAAVFGQWLNSPSQNANMLNPLFAAIGIGNSSNPDASFVNYWAAAFGNDASVELAAPCEVPTEVPTPTAAASPATLPTEAPAATPITLESPTSTVAVPTVESASPVAGSPTSTGGSPVGATPVAEATVTSGVACASDREVARAGQDVVVTCAGFEPNEEVELYWDQPLASSRVQTAKTDAGGSVGFVFPALEVPSQRYIIIVRSVTTRLTATMPIEIRPGLFLVPRSGDPGDVISADLTGFQPGEAVTIIWFDDATTTRVLRQITVGEDGSWTTTFRAPAAKPGIYRLDANGLGGGKATANFEIELR